MALNPSVPKLVTVNGHHAPRGGSIAWIARHDGTIAVCQACFKLPIKRLFLGHGYGGPRISVRYAVGFRSTADCRRGHSRQECLFPALRVGSGLLYADIKRYLFYFRQRVESGTAGLVAIPCARRGLSDLNAVLSEKTNAIPPRTRSRHEHCDGIQSQKKDKSKSLNIWPSPLESAKNCP